jgi:ArsR family transcriptional regulator
MNTSTARQTAILSGAELDRVARQFRVLGEPMRLKILQAICAKPLTVNGIVKATGASQPNVSRHLSLLAASGLIARKKQARFVYYQLCDPLTLKLCELVHSQLLVRR